MKFPAEDFITAIEDSDLTEDQKRTIYAKLKVSGKINDSLYLKKDNEGNFECWYRNVDEKGVVDQGPTDYGIEEVLQEYIKTLEENKESTHTM